MARVLLLEGSAGAYCFKPDRQAIVESKTVIGETTVRTKEIPGILSQCDVKNGNNRRYRRSVWEKNLTKGSRLLDLIERKQAWGMLEHPADGVCNAGTPNSHMVTEVKLRPDSLLEGKLVIFEDLPEGHRLSVYIANGWDPMVSSRGYGSVERVSDGIDEVQDDYVCEGWDVVAVPSFSNAQLTPSRQAQSSESLAPVRVVENKPALPPTAVAPKQKQIMELNQIKSTISGLRTVNILTASKSAITESFVTVATLHQAISEHLGANPSQSWECNQLHEQINEIATGWHTSITKLQEDLTTANSCNERLVKLSEALASTAKIYRERLTETVARKNSLVKVFETVVTRARKWTKLAEARKTQATSLEEQCAISCVAIEQLAKKCVLSENGDPSTTTGKALRLLGKKCNDSIAESMALARKVVELTYPADAATKEIKEKLDAAKDLDTIATIKEDLDKAHGVVVESKVPVAAPAAPAPVAKAPITESAPPVAPAPVAAAPAKTDGNKIEEGVTTVRGDTITGHTLSLEQTIGVARRSVAKSAK